MRTRVTTGGTEAVLKGQLDWVYPEELNTSTAYWWSPDSSKIAYYQMDERPVTRYPIVDMSSPAGDIEYTRFPQAGEANPIVRVGVVPVAGGETKWMDTGANTDVYLARVDWLRDSNRIAIQRLNRAQNELDLLFCDVSSGAAQNCPDGNRQILGEHQRRSVFLQRREALLVVERAHRLSPLLSYDLSGKEIEQVTSGDWAITGTQRIRSGRGSHPAVDEAHGYIYFLSNKDSVPETQLYRVSLADKRIERITKAAWNARCDHRAGRLGVRRRIFECDDAAAAGLVSRGRKSGGGDQ